MEGKLLLRYFDIRGKAELIRLTLEEAGVKYEEVNLLISSKYESSK